MVNDAAINYIEAKPVDSTMKRKSKYYLFRNERPISGVNPFVHTLDLNTFYDQFKIVFMSIFVLPIRVCLIFACLLIAYGFAYIGMMGKSRESLSERPLSGWRRAMRCFVCHCVRFIYTLFGFYTVHVKGQPSKSKEAPILAVAPHSSMFDALPVVVLGAPSPVAKGELRELTLFSKFIDYTQPVYVWREDQNSRQTTISEIKERANSEYDWPQIMIFPEGTCSNRSCLITFKPGAFYPGVPIQPVIIRYANKTDCVTWTWDGPGAMKLLWVTLCQFQNYCEVEYLPVYHPSEEEKRDPHLFAANVRQVMADALGVPVVDYTYDDCRVMHKALQKNFPCDIGLVEFQKLRRKFGNINLKDVEGPLLDEYAEVASADGKLGLDGFANYLKLPVKESAVEELFNLYKADTSDSMNFRDFLIYHCEVSAFIVCAEAVQKLFDLISARNDGNNISTENFVESLQINFGLGASSTVFQDVKCQDNQAFTFELFENVLMRKRAASHIMFLYWKKFIDDGDNLLETDAATLPGSLSKKKNE